LLHRRGHPPSPAPVEARQDLEPDAADIVALLGSRPYIVAPPTACTDNGSNWFLGASNRRGNDDNLNQLKALPGSALEVVRLQADVQVC
jgi:hypothetical protein